MVVFRKLCRVAQSSRTHKAESVTAIGRAQLEACAETVKCLYPYFFIVPQSVGVLDSQQGRHTADRCSGPVVPPEDSWHPME